MQPSTQDPIAALEAKLARREARLAALGETWLRDDRDPWLLAAWTIAVAARLTLAQATQPTWVLPDLLLLVATVGLWWRGGRIFWWIAVLSFIIPLYSLGDWLTQSVIMLAVAFSGGLGKQRAARDAARALGIVTYGLAVFHKLNTGFLDPNLSCATNGWIQLGSWLHAVQLPASPSLIAWLPSTILIVESFLLIALIRWPRAAWIVGAAFHIPLTMVLAPAFVFIMGIAYASALGTKDRTTLLTAWRLRKSTLLSGTLVGVGVLVLLMGRVVFLVLMIKLVILVFVGVWAATSFLVETPTQSVHEVPRERWPWIVAVLFVAHAMTPYLGAQVQHTGAMLSNLRIDAGCWNHVVVPEAVRLEDPYLRFDSASLGNSAHDTLGTFEEHETLLTSRLWSPYALRAIRRNWCTDRTRPIWVQGTYLGAPITIADICTDPLPPSRGLLGVGRWTPGVLRFQKNLDRTCPQTCVH